MQDLAPKKAIYMAFAAKKCHHIDNRAWGDIWSDCRIAALSRLYRVSVARRREGRTCLIGRETWILIFFLPFSFPFLCFSSIITNHHYHSWQCHVPSNIPLPWLSTTKLRPHLTPLASCRHTPDIGPYWGSPCLTLLVAEYKCRISYLKGRTWLSVALYDLRRLLYSLLCLIELGWHCLLAIGVHNHCHSYHSTILRHLHFSIENFQGLT